MSIFSFGLGIIQIFIFTDYFCPPCQHVESYLDQALPKLYRAGVTVAFVDKPINQHTPLYSRYFLYAANASNDLDNALHARRVLFDSAKNSIESESELFKALKDSNIDLALMNVKPVFSEWAILVKKFGIRSTPTCVITYPNLEPMVFNGEKKIIEGIEALLDGLAD